ncbi:baeRF3 domain-containing protein [Neorhodopirellula pilleata]|uniref:Uncharacterized protein n=1 Tax=Neorhodopirellula pilleata TaxID=2714738 RepID=A0A5C6A8F5_9BACT|nr:hypothetical protein [Neorhodopirellula pilleata]TWT96244.1 hypothetical protein Pla100_27200 [Neorhodopirellula pilleata]
MSSTANETDFQTLHQDDLAKLVQVEGQPCVSILMPTHIKGSETKQDPIRLKNLVKKAASLLNEKGHDASVLDSLQRFIRDEAFWQHQGHGLAIYLANDDVRCLRLNRNIDEMVHVGDHFLVSPLIQETNSQGRYFTLALSWDRATLYRCEGDSMTIVETQRLPAGFDDLVLPRDPEESLQNTSHRTLGNTGGASIGMFHGQGEGEDKIEADRDQYLSIVGDQVSGAIYNTGMPLVIVATQEVTGHFNATTQTNVDAHVDGSPSSMSETELHQAAHKAIASQLQTDHNSLNERLGTAMAGSQASQRIEDIVAAAQTGKVDTLLICDIACEQTNTAVVATIAQGGKVYRCESERVPGTKSKIAAIYRY